MYRIIFAALLCSLSTNAFAAWNVGTGNRMTIFPPLTGKVATVNAKAPFKSVTARLQLECYTSKDFASLSFGIVLSQKPANGFMAWRYQYDDAPPVQTKPYSRSLPPEAIHLGDGSGAETKILAGAKRLKLTLLPADGSELPYEFDVMGAADAIKALSCKESSR